MECFFISYEYKCSSYLLRPYVPKGIKRHKSSKSSYLLLVVGDDAAYKVGVGVAECGHQLGQLFLVELGHGPEHALPGAGTEHRVSARRRSHTNDLSWNTHTPRCQITH